MNMAFARAMAIACLTVMKGLCWFTGGLLLLLTAVQFVRGDIDARPVLTIVTGAVFVGIGFGSGWLSRKLEDMPA